MGKGGPGLGCTVRDETRENQGHRQDLGARFNTIDFYTQMGVSIFYIQVLGRVLMAKYLQWTDPGPQVRWWGRTRWSKVRKDTELKGCY